MNLSAYYDFYPLMAMANTPADIRSRAQIEFVENARYLLDTMSHDFARALRDYMFLVSFGEARHANGKARDWYFPSIDGLDRVSANKLALKYDPDVNLPKLTDLFSKQDWEGSFGGKNWGNVARAAQKYDGKSDTFFIDHVASIEHNGGQMFNKMDIYKTIKFYIDIEGNYFKWYLQYVFESRDLLGKPFPTDAEQSTFWYANMSMKVIYMWKRYTRIFGVDCDLSFATSEEVSNMANRLNNHSSGYTRSRAMQCRKDFDKKTEYTWPKFGDKVLDTTGEVEHWQPDEDDEQEVMDQDYSRYIEQVKHYLRRLGEHEREAIERTK